MFQGNVRKALGRAASTRGGTAVNRGVVSRSCLYATTMVAVFLLVGILWYMSESLRNLEQQQQQQEAGLHDDIVLATANRRLEKARLHRQESRREEMVGGDDGSSDEGALDGVWDIHELDETASAASQYKKHNFTAQLPVGASKFCTAFEDPRMEVMEPYAPAQPADPDDLPNRTFWVDGCQQPVVLLPFKGLKMYPQLKCGALKLWKMFVVTLRHPVETSKAGSRPPATGLTPAMGTSVEPPVTAIKKCLEQCLLSPCCLTITLQRASDRGFHCGLQYCDYTRAHFHREPVEKFSGFSYVLAYRREYRPSLVRSDWRLAVHRAPPRVLRLDPADSWAGALGGGDGGPLFDVRAVAEHGTLLQPVRGTARIRARCISSLSVVTFSNRSSVSDLTGPYYLREPLSPTRIPFVPLATLPPSAVLLDVTSPELQLFSGYATSNGEWMSPRLLWETCAGHVLVMDFAATISKTVPDEPLKTPFPQDDDDVLTLTTQLHSLVHRNATHTELLFQPPKPGRSKYGEVTLPPGLFRNDAASCAAHLREGECCLSYVMARQVTDSRMPSPLSVIADASHPALEGSYVLLALETDGLLLQSSSTSAPPSGNLTESAAATQQPAVTCVRLVDGFTSHFDEDGIARFPNLVVWVNRREGACVHDGVRMILRLRQRFPADGIGRQSLGNRSTGGAVSISIPLSWLLAGCGRKPPSLGRTGRDDAEGDGGGAGTGKPSAPPYGDELPILVSVPAHECLECLHSFLMNIRAFVWPSVVVIHFPSTMARFPTEQELAALNRSHPMTFVNRHRVDSVVGVRLLHIHGLNVHFAAKDLTHLRLSHALFLASNELFVRHGTVEYIRRHDAVFMHNPTADSGALYEHHGDGRHRWTVQEFLPMEEMLRYPPRRWGFVWPDAVVADHWLAAAMRRRNLVTHPLNTVLLEGTFFRWDIAVEFATEIMEMFDPFDFCEDPMLYPHCEILGPTIFQGICERAGVRCGHRVTTMLWLRDGWTSVIDDVRRVRCSPFEVPFGFKRVPRDMKDPVRTEILRFTTQALVSRRVTYRDENVTFCREASH